MLEVIATKYGVGIAGKIFGAIGNAATKRRIDRVDALLGYVDKKASGYKLPTGFDQQEEFEDFAYAVCDAAARTSNEKKLRLLALVLLNEAADPARVSYEPREKIQELLPLVQVHHIELLKIIHDQSQVPHEARNVSDVRSITYYENKLHSLANIKSTEAIDLFHGAVSDLLRWYLIRSTTNSGVGIAKAASFIPGASTMGFLCSTNLGRILLEYLRDPNGAFINLETLDQPD